MKEITAALNPRSPDTPIIRRPVILTVNGRADSVLLDVRVYERYMQAGNLAKLLAPAEREVEAGRTCPARDFLKEFKRAKRSQG